MPIQVFVSKTAKKKSLWWVRANQRKRFISTQKWGVLPRFERGASVKDHVSVTFTLTVGLPLTSHLTQVHPKLWNWLEWLLPFEVLVNLPRIIPLDHKTVSYWLENAIFNYLIYQYGSFRDMSRLCSKEQVTPDVAPFLHLTLYNSFHSHLTPPSNL